MVKKVNLTGQRFGRLVVLADSGKRYKGKSILWRCICSCGNITDVAGYNLKNGNTKSCGCLQRKHGESNRNITRLYRIWRNMKTRCYNPNQSNYKYYYAKGIKVYKKWKNDYLTFKKWALANGYKNDLTIDRIDNNGNYEPLNCQWITLSENSKKGRIKL